MTELVTGLFGVTGLLFVAAVLSGVLFDRIDAGSRRDAAVGLLLGVAAGVAVLAAVRLPGGVVADVRGPLLITAGLFGGWVGFLAALPIPLGLRLEAGGTWVAGVVSIFMYAGLGAVVRQVVGVRARSVSRSAAMWAAVASPLALLSVLLIPGIDSSFFWTVVVPFAAFNAIGTLLIGIALSSELSRSETDRSRKRRESFDALTKMLPPDVFASQLLHQWKLYEFSNVPHAYILVSIDGASALLKKLGEKAYDALRAEIAMIVSEQVRGTDLATTRDFDRFAILIPQGDVQIARSVGSRIQETVRAKVKGPDGPITVSVGLADVADGFQAGDVEAAAEGALFQANGQKAADAIGPTCCETLATNVAESEFRSPSWYHMQSGNTATTAAGAPPSDGDGPHSPPSRDRAAADR